MRLSSLLLLPLLAVLIMSSPAISSTSQSFPEDINGDGKVDIKDLVIISRAFGYTINNNQWNPNLDIIADGKIDIQDIARVAFMFGICAPTAAFTESAHIAPIGTPIKFDPSNSLDMEGRIVLYEWDFTGDGIYDKSTTSPEEVSYTYTIPGEYNVTLRVTDDYGLTDTAIETKIITPLGVIPEVPFGTIVASSAMIIAFLGYFAVKRRRRESL